MGKRRGLIGWAVGDGEEVGGRGVSFELIKERESYADKDMC